MLSRKLEGNEEGKDQELIQSCTTPDLRPHIGKCKNTRKYDTQESPEVNPFPAGDHKAARNRKDSIIKTNVKHKDKKGPQKKHRL